MTLRDRDRRTAWRTPGDLLIGLVALAGDQHDIARQRRRRRRARWRRRDRARPSAASSCRRGSASMIACGSSLRGLSLVSHDAIGQASRPWRPSAAACRDRDRRRSRRRRSACRRAPRPSRADAEHLLQRVRACGRSRPPPAARPRRRCVCMRPGGGAMRGSTAAMSASVSSPASKAPITASRLAALKRPTTGAANAHAVEREAQAGAAHAQVAGAPASRSPPWRSASV